MKNPWSLSDEAEQEIYIMYDENISPLVKKEDGSIDLSKNNFSGNLLDAFRHAYVSGIFTIEYGELTAELFGRLNEIIPYLLEGRDSKDINMDLWNNNVGRKMGKKAKNKIHLFQLLLDVKKNGELIENLDDKRIYRGKGFIANQERPLVIVLEDTKSGENIIFYDIAKKEIMTKGHFVSQIKNSNYKDYEIRIIGGNDTPVTKKDGLIINNLG